MGKDKRKGVSRHVRTIHVSYHGGRASTTDSVCGPRQISQSKAELKARRGASMSSLYHHLFLSILYTEAIKFRPY